MANLINEVSMVEIASELELGMLVFYHKETGELIIYPDESRHPFFDSSEWKTEINTVKKAHKKFLKFEPMNTSQEMRMMHHFTDDINPAKNRERFEEALCGRKPFGIFKQLLQKFPDLQQRWYQFKTSQYNQWAKEQLEAHQTGSGAGEKK